MISIVIPTYNRSKHLEEITASLTAFLQDQYGDFELIYVDDGSVDDTAVTLERLASRYPSVMGIVLLENAGQQNASLAGIRASHGDLVVTMDDDLRYGLSGLVKLTDEMNKGFDVVYGYSGHQSDGVIRWLGTHLKEWMFSLLCHRPKNVHLTSFRVMNKSVVAYICSDQSAKVYLSAKILQHTRHIRSVSVDNNGHRQLPSNYTLTKLLIVFGWIFRNYTVPGRWLHLNVLGRQYVIKEIYC